MKNFIPRGTRLDSHETEKRRNDHRGGSQTVLVGEKTRRHDAERCKDVRRCTESLGIGRGEAHVLDNGREGEGESIHGHRVADEAERQDPHVRRLVISRDRLVDVNQKSGLTFMAETASLNLNSSFVPILLPPYMNLERRTRNRFSRSESHFFVCAGVSCSVNMAMIPTKTVIEPSIT